MDNGNTEGYRETKMCVCCEGGCCQRQSGHCLPSEFESAEAVRMAVVSGKYAIVLLVDKDIMARIIRPSSKDLSRSIDSFFIRPRDANLSLRTDRTDAVFLSPVNGMTSIARPKGYSIVEAAEMWEESGYLPPIEDCLANYPELRGTFR